MKANCYLKQAWTHNGSVKTDLPLMIVAKARKRQLIEAVRPGQLFGVGKVYLRTHNSLVGIK